MTWQLVSLILGMSTLATVFFFVARITRDAVSAKDLLKALNLIDARINELNALLNPMLRGRNPMGPGSHGLGT